MKKQRNDSKRIYGDVVRISEDDVQSFFDSRAKKSLPHRYNYAIYQDSNPELALERDGFEKRYINEVINYTDDSLILDIGCGVGRWGDEFVSRKIKKYVGIDISDEYLKIARTHFKEQNEKYAFIKSDFLNAKENLRENDLLYQYDYILINGVFVYINDSDILQCMDIAKELLSKHGIIYIKDAVGTNERLTLNKFHSDELGSDYSAIYRTLQEWNTWIGEVFPKDDYEVLKKGPIWPEDLNNRKDTKQWHWIIKHIQ